MLTPMFYSRTDEESTDYAQFTFEPLYPSFGQSLGNALRRTLLSSLPGAAISFIKIKDTPHLFTTVKGVKESALDIVLNLKQLRFKVPSTEGKFKIQLKKKGAGKVYGKDIEGEAEVINNDQYIAEITDEKESLEIDLIVETGYGYILAEEKEMEETGYTTVDSSFSPVRKVNFKIEAARVGRKSNFERLILEVWTDGSISPREAIEQSASLLTQNFSHVFAAKDTSKETGAVTAEQTTEEVNSKLNDIIIDELNLPSRVINALLRENIETVADLIKRGRENLVGLKGVGRKSIDLIEEELKKMNIELK